MNRCTPKAATPIYVMDQISDKKNREENWVQDLALQDAISPAESQGKIYHPASFF